MSGAPFMPLAVNDYLGDTRHLSTEQHGAFLLLLMTMWNAGGELVDDDAKLARITGLSRKKWLETRPTLLDLLDVSDGVISHSKLTKMRQKITTQSDLRRAAGSKGGTAKALKEKQTGLASASDLPDVCHSNHNHNHNQIDESTIVASSYIANSRPNPEPEQALEMTGLFDLEPPPKPSAVAARPPALEQVAQAVAAYIETANRYGLPVPGSQPTGARLSAIKARLKDHGLTGWQEALSQIDRSRFLQRGSGNGRKSPVTIDWMSNPTNFTKIIEGNYNDQRTDHDSRNGSPYGSDQRSSGRGTGVLGAAMDAVRFYSEQERMGAGGEDERGRSLPLLPPARPV